MWQDLQTLLHGENFYDKFGNLAAAEFLHNVGRHVHLRNKEGQTLIYIKPFNVNIK